MAPSERLPFQDFDVDSYVPFDALSMRFYFAMDLLGFEPRTARL